MNRSYIPALDVLRAVSCVGIMVTHVAFQTGIGVRVLERFDYFVAVFFALSGFLLWWRYQPGTDWVAYYRSRFFRIVPAYVVTVCVTFVAFQAGGPQALLATLLFSQIYVPGALMVGLTHLWTMCVEVAFYLILPLLRRVPWWGIGALGIASLGWAFLPFVQAAEVNAQIFPPAYMLWYAVGICCAEW